jgi:hypothetical protein
MLNTSDANLARLLLVRKPRASAAASSSSSASATSAATPSKSGPSGAGAGASTPSRRDTDADTVATAALDLSPTAQKMRKVLGKSGMAAVLADVKKSTGKGSPAGASAVPGDQLRDTLAKHGVPLTGKEVRALSIKYHGSGSGSDPVVDVEAMLRDTFISAPSPAKAGASLTKSAASPVVKRK